LLSGDRKHIATKRMRPDKIYIYTNPRRTQEEEENNSYVFSTVLAESRWYRRRRRRKTERTKGRKEGKERRMGSRVIM